MIDISSLQGLILLWLTTMIPQAKPPMGESPNAGQLALLFSSFVFMSIGAGGIRPCSVAFGADQLVRDKDDPKNQRILQTYFGWYYASVGLSIVISLIVLVYIQDHLGWKLGFGIPAILMFVSSLTFFLGSPLYVKATAIKSLFTGLAQVIVVSFKNRSIPYSADEQYYYSKESHHVKPSEGLRFFNKACVIRDAVNGSNSDGSTSKPLNLCTVEQVEALKSLVRVLPIWSTGIIIYMSNNEGTLSVLQASCMDRHLTSNFEIPAGSFAVFTVIILTIWVAVYDRAVVPFLSRFTGQPYGLSNVARMGIGLVLSVVAKVVAATVEVIRRRRAIHGIVGMSAFWLVPQYSLVGLATALNSIGQIEFFYSQLPKNMASLAMALSSLNSAFAGLLGSFLVKSVDMVTKHGGKESWVAKDPNKGHYDYFYWFLAILCTANFLYFLLCCWAYGPSEEIPKNSYE